MKLVEEVHSKILTGRGCVLFFNQFCESEQSRMENWRGKAFRLGRGAESFDMGCVSAGPYSLLINPWI